MSQENVEIARRSVEAFARGDYEKALQVLDPEVEFDLRHIPDGSVYHGHAGVREAFRIWLGTWEDYRLDVSEFIDAGDEVVVCVRDYGRGKGSGLALDRPSFSIWKLTDGLVVRIRFRGTKAEALEAAGLSV
jgi:ketosteroid isomerase-like protein